MIQEKDIEEHLYKRAEELGCYCIKLPASIVAGIPDDLIVTLDGRCIFCEIKNGSDGKLSKYQIYTQERLRKMHQLVHTLWSIEDVDNFINKELLYR